jgi:hypothetical protein
MYEAVLQGMFMNGLDNGQDRNFNIADSSDEEASWRT